MQAYNKNYSLLGEGLRAPADKSPTSHHHQQSQHTKGDIDSAATQSTYTPFRKVEFPHFGGTNPRVWVRKCNRYFQIVSTISDGQKVTLVAVHLENKAELWFQGFLEGRDMPSWHEFVMALFERFEDIDPELIIGEFNKLQQESSLAGYLEKFEELKSHMLIFNKDLFEEFFTASFESGLGDEIRGTVMTLKQTKPLP